MIDWDKLHPISAQQLTRLIQQSLSGYERYVYCKSRYHPAFSKLAVKLHDLPESIQQKVITELYEYQEKGRLHWLPTQVKKYKKKDVQQEKIAV